MADAEISLKIYSNESLVYSGTLTSMVFVGRQDKGEPPPYKYCEASRGRKLVIARNNETSVSREQASLELVNSRLVRIANLSANVPIQLDDGRTCEPIGKSCPEDSVCEVPLPVLFNLGDLSLRVEAAGGDLLTNRGSELRNLAEPTLAPGQFRENAPALADLLAEQRDLPAESLMRWLLDTMSVFQHCSSVQEFLEHATKALIDMVGLDFGSALLWHDGQWTTAATVGESLLQPSQTILENVRTGRRSFMFSPSDAPQSSLDGVVSVVAAPILDIEGRVLGVLYGDRRLKEDMRQLEISDLETMVVELVASGAANGLARLEQQEAALKAARPVCPVLYSAARQGAGSESEVAQRSRSRGHGTILRYPGVQRD